MALGTNELVRVSRSLSGKGREDLASLLSTPRSSSDMHSFVQNLLSIPGRRQAIMSLNERGADVARDLEVGAEVPRACARIALAAGTAIAIVELMRTLRHAAEPLWAVAIFAVAGIFAFACAQIARLARKRAERRIAAWNSLLAALLPLLPPEAAAQNPEISSSCLPGCGPASRTRLP